MPAYFEFVVVTIGALRAEQSRRHQQADYRIEELEDGVILEMVSLSNGSFTMGSPDDEKGQSGEEGPQHDVIVSAFEIGKYPVTQAQWRAVTALPKVNYELNSAPVDLQKRIGVREAVSRNNNHPVERVSWLEAMEFCDRLSQKTGRQYRLPSEAEWEYACRAGTTTPFHFGETITTNLANYRETNWNNEETFYSGSYGKGAKGVFRGETTSVGSFGVANNFGLYDMHGNVYEWCLDHWHQSYEGAPTDGSAWLDDYDHLNSKAKRLLRGGSWLFYPESCRSASRCYNNADLRYYSFGFRVACALT
jgi:formylglycine-generating enzyme required for sulfatase activity